MVPTQDFALLARFATPLRLDAPVDYLPAGVVAVVVLALAFTMLLVAVRRADSD
jgi:hypothetical protein